MPHTKAVVANPSPFFPAPPTPEALGHDSDSPLPCLAFQRQCPKDTHPEELSEAYYLAAKEGSLFLIAQNFPPMLILLSIRYI